MITELAEHFLELSCLLLAAGVSVSMIVGAVRGKRGDDAE